MLDWFNVLITLVGEFLQLFLDLPFYGSITIGYVLIAITVFSIIFKILIERIK